VALLIDRSDRGKLAFTGEEAAAFLDSQVTNDVRALRPGTGCSAAVLTTKGKMLGEVRILDTGDELFVDTDRPALQAVFDALRRGMVGWRSELHKRTVQQSLLTLVGDDLPVGADLPEQEHANARAQVGGADVLLVRTAFGVDIVCAAEDRDRVRAALATVADADDDVLEVRRVEAGRPRWGAELDETVIPQEAGLNERLVSFTKGCYPGQETVARLHYKGKPNRHLRGLRFVGDDVPAPGTPLVLDGREVGRVGSVVRSPDRGAIGLALVRREAEPGTQVTAGEDGGPAAEVVALPF
jgi:folate-binding protein YgfZ